MRGFRGSKLHPLYDAAFLGISPRTRDISACPVAPNTTPTLSRCSSHPGGLAVPQLQPQSSASLAPGWDPQSCDSTSGRESATWPWLRAAAWPPLWREQGPRHHTPTT